MMHWSAKAAAACNNCIKPFFLTKCNSCPSLILRYLSKWNGWTLWQQTPRNRWYKGDDDDLLTWSFTKETFIIYWWQHTIFIFLLKVYPATVVLLTDSQLRELRLQSMVEIATGRAACQVRVKRYLSNIETYAKYTIHLCIHNQNS